MSHSATYRRFKRRISQITRRINTGPKLQVRQLSAEVMEILSDLRRAADDEPEIAIELGLSLLEDLPQILRAVAVETAAEESSGGPSRVRLNPVLQRR